jgi:uncharacterized membrane protein
VRRVSEAPANAQELERERDLDRFLTFVDAIVAIAITLLVLPLAELPAELADGESVGHLLREHLGEIGAFALSFYVIAGRWQSQHRSVSPLLRGSTRITWLLMFWTFTIVVLPFPTALVAEAAEDPATKVFYLGTMIASTLTTAAVRREVEKHPELTDGTTVASALRTATTPAVMLVALVLMLVFPQAEYWPMFLLVVDGRIAHLIERAHARKQAAS